MFCAQWYLATPRQSAERSGANPHDLGRHQTADAYDCPCPEQCLCRPCIRRQWCRTVLFGGVSPRLDFAAALFGADATQPWSLQGRLFLHRLRMAGDTHADIVYLAETKVD